MKEHEGQLESQQLGELASVKEILDRLMQFSYHIELAVDIFF